MDTLTELRVPDPHPAAGMAHAAWSYAVAGWYVLPVLRSNPKHAGAALGKGWPEKTSRDPDQISRWFTHRAADRLGLALHVGRSGAVCFDVDDPTHLPPLLRDALDEYRPPYQSTRTAEPGRGHYLFALPQGVVLGNGKGTLRTDPTWGDVRGTNGIIVAAPTPHHKAALGGRYAWQTTGPLPELPKALGAALLGSPGPATGRRAPTGLNGKGRAQGLLDKLLSAQEGDRNNLLFWTSCRFGELVAADAIAEADAADVLGRAADSLGLRPSESSGTIASGIRTGGWAASW